MVFFILGWGFQTHKTLCTVLPSTCDNCHNISEWVVMRRKTWFTLFFIPILPYRVEQFAVCPVCCHGAEITNQQWRELKKSNNKIATVVNYEYSFYSWFMRGLAKRKWRYLYRIIFIVLLIVHRMSSVLVVIGDFFIAIIISYVVLGIPLCLGYAIISKAMNRHIVGISLEDCM